MTLNPAQSKKCKAALNLKAQNAFRIYRVLKKYNSIIRFASRQGA
jgi:hypothetical protein